MILRCLPIRDFWPFTRDTINTCSSWLSSQPRPLVLFVLLSYYRYLKNPHRWEGRQPWAAGASSDRRVLYCKSSNMRQSQLIPHTCHTSIEGSAKYSYLPPRPLLSNLLAENGRPRRGRKWWFCLLLPVLHAFTQEGRQSPRCSYTLATQSTSHTPSLRDLTTDYWAPEKKGHGVKQLTS